MTVQSQGGHQLTLDDDGSQGKIEVKTSAGHTPHPGRCRRDGDSQR
jgi:hypothetical protein